MLIELFAKKLRLLRQDLEQMRKKLLVLTYGRPRAHGSFDELGAGFVAKENPGVVRPGDPLDLVEVTMWR